MDLKARLIPSDLGIYSLREKVEITVQNVNSHAGNVGIWRRARIATRICKIRVLNQQVWCGDISLLSDNADSTSLTIVTNYL